MTVDANAGCRMFSTSRRFVLSLHFCVRMHRSDDMTALSCYSTLTAGMCVNEAITMIKMLKVNTISLAVCSFLIIPGDGWL